MDYEIIASGAGGNTSTPDYEILAKGVPISSGKELPTSRDILRNPQAQGRPDDEHRIVNALGEIIPRPQQQLQDIGRGAMKGFADVGESVASLFGNYENPVSKDFLDASQYWADEQVRPESGAVGETASDTLVGGSVGKLFGKTMLRKTAKDGIDNMKKMDDVYKARPDKQLSGVLGSEPGITPPAISAAKSVLEKISPRSAAFVDNVWKNISGRTISPANKKRLLEEAATTMGNKFNMKYEDAMKILMKRSEDAYTATGALLGGSDISER